MSNLSSYEAKEVLKYEREFDSFAPLYENFEKLKPDQQKVLELLIQGQNVRDIATECNVNEATIYRWLQQDNFYSCLKKWQYHLLVESDNRLQKLIFKGIDKLEFVLDNPDKFEGKYYLQAIEISLRYLERK